MSDANEKKLVIKPRQESIFDNFTRHRNSWVRQASASFKKTLMTYPLDKRREKYADLDAEVRDGYILLLKSVDGKVDLDTVMIEAAQIVLSKNEKDLVPYEKVQHLRTDVQSDAGGCPV